MVEPDLELLKAGNKAAWDSAFDWLWPTAIAVAKGKLFEGSGAVEDIAIESIEKLIKHVPNVKQIQELKALLAKITHDECVTFIRKNQAKKRGEGKTLSLEEMIENVGEMVLGRDLSGNLENRDLIRLIMGLLIHMKPKERMVFKAFHTYGLNYEDISRKHRIPVGSVGVYLKRAHEALHKLLGGLGEDFL